MLLTKPEGMKYIIVEGNIGAGKSTFLRIVQSLPNVNVIFEPLEKWQNVGDGENLFDTYYHNQQRWSYTFQTYAFVTRIVKGEQIARTNDKPIQILERSVYSDRYCFADGLFQMGAMTALEWQLYQEWFSWLVDTHTVKPDGFIYLRTTPDVCYERMKIRNRSEESQVPLSYLQLLHEKHENWLVQKKEIASYLLDIPVLTLDCNIDFEHCSKQQEVLVTAVQSFLHEQSMQKKSSEKSSWL